MSAAKKKLDTDQVAQEFANESAFFQPVTISTQTGKTTSGQVDKWTRPQVEKYTTHLLPTTIKAVKRYAFEHDLKDYEVVQAALDRFLSESEKQPVSPTPVAQPRYVLRGEPVPDDLISLPTFADQHGVARNEAERLWKIGMIAGVRVVGKGVMLYPKGLHDFWIQFHKTPGFRACDNCPHTQQ